MVDISKYKKKKERKKIAYPSIPSSIAPVNHGPELPISEPPTTHAILSTSSEDDNADFKVDTQCSSKLPHFPNQNQLDDLTRDLDLTKAKAEILSSPLKEWNLLAPLCKISKPRKRHVTFCTNQQPPQRGGAVPDSVWVGSKWLLAFPRVPVTPGTPLHFFAMLPPERPQEGSTQHLQNRSPVFTISSPLPYSCPSFSPHSSSPDER